MDVTPGLEVLRYAAFTDDPAGGNPAGVVIGPSHPSDVEMQRIAAEIGYSETAFLAPLGPDHQAPDSNLAPRRYRVRYFSPVAEVPFCGHATIASGVALAERDGRPDGEGHRFARIELVTNGGVVPVETERDSGGVIRATLISLPPRVSSAPPALVEGALSALGWQLADLDTRFPPGVAFAGASHLVLVVTERSTLAGLRYDFDALRELMLAADLTTLQLAWQEGPRTFRVRDPFPVGGVVEDPATGAAAAAFGAYLRELGAVPARTSLTLLQGEDMGRPSLLTVDLVAGQPEVRVSGLAVPI